MNASEKPTILTPFFAASSIMEHVFLTEACKSSHSGSYCAAATRRVVGEAVLPIVRCEKCAEVKKKNSDLDSLITVQKEDGFLSWIFAK